MVIKRTHKTTTQTVAEFDDITIEYPEEDGEPLAETDFQFVPLTYAVTALRARFGSRNDIYVAGNMLLDYREEQVRRQLEALLRAQDGDSS